MSEETVYTFEDAIDRLLDNFGELSGDGRNARVAREAVLSSYRTLPGLHSWKYYSRRQLFTTDPSYGIGTIEYDHTGNAKGERVFLLTTGTWPANVEFGNLKIANYHWPVVKKIDSTTVQGLARANPGADIAAGTQYVWYRDAYQYPVRARRHGELYDPLDYRLLPYVDRDQGLGASRAIYDTVNRPLEHSVGNDDRFQNSLSIILIPAPNTARTYEYVVELQGQELTTPVISSVANTGTVTTVGTAVTFSGSVLTSKQLGCIVRFADDGETLDPTSLRGSLLGIQPFKYQRVLAEVTSGTVGVLDQALDTDLTAVKYTVSSPIDLETGSMLNAFWRLCDYEFTKTSRMDPKTVAAARAMFIEELDYARESDRRSTSLQTANPTGHGRSILGDVAVR